MIGHTSSDPIPSRPDALALTSTSRAADAGFLALADMSSIAAELRLDYRIVGGHMVTLLTAAHGVAGQVPMRETLDADFAALPTVIADPRLLRALAERGYQRVDAANRFVRDRRDDLGPLNLVVDILAPSYQSTLVPNQRHGDLVVDEVHGLVLALNRPATLLHLDVRLTSADELSLRVALPDVASALCVKALAYRGRFAGKDAIDLWRLLNAAYVAGLRVESWPTSVTGRDAAQILHRFFGAPGATGLKQVSARSADRTRMQALVGRIVARPE
ncbi:hypothetical protein EV384_1953 [Micromonospora kangleipakensis]|uniref:Nucleotidyltransferase AbiEii toxin of type IV toxin-antitoxin system n=1 Tax=Micromonospora kangleipakensis TaxID=1077942 RepID=A0A4V6MGS1_9ACTN|nr:hypothetical protein [Micromonospora kangleipakensis]RZU73546.1 hypothetical protein EV384_1953 [Micromonospora kangleipakensis]